MRMSPGLGTAAHLLIPFAIFPSSKTSAERFNLASFVAFVSMKLQFVAFCTCLKSEKSVVQKGLCNRLKMERRPSLQGCTWCLQMKAKQ